MLARALLSQAVESAVARFLARDPDHACLLEPLAGKVIAVMLEPFGPRLYFSPTEDTVLVLAEWEEPPEVTVRGAPAAFLRLLLSERPETGLFQGLVRVEGNLDSARRLQNLLRRLDLDWDRWVAEVAGERVAGVARDVVVWHRRAWHTFQWNLAEFLQEESRALPASPEAEDLYRRISQLRDDVERLEARLRRLRQA